MALVASLAAAGAQAKTCNAPMVSRRSRNAFKAIEGVVLLTLQLIKIKENGFKRSATAVVCCPVLIQYQFKHFLPRTSDSG